VCVLALAQSGSTEVESQHGKSKAVERFHGVKDDLVMQGSTEHRMRMAHDRRMRRVWRSGIQQRFQPPGRAVEE